MYNKYVIVPLLRWRGTRSIINRREKKKQEKKKIKEQRVESYKLLQHLVQS